MERKGEVVYGKNINAWEDTMKVTEQRMFRAMSQVLDMTQKELRARIDDPLLALVNDEFDPRWTEVFCQIEDELRITFPDDIPMGITARGILHLVEEKLRLLEPVST